MIQELPSDICKAIQGAIKMTIEDETTRLIEEAQKKLAAQIPTIVAGVALQLMKVADMHVIGDRLTITIALKERKS
jgi:hypothetical protein